MWCTVRRRVPADPSGEARRRHRTGGDERPLADEPLPAQIWTRPEHLAPA